MWTTSVSTLSLFNSPRSEFSRMQAEAGRLTKEITTGRHADVGLALGAATSRSIELRSIGSALSAMIDGNASALARLSQTDLTLERIAGDADRFLQSVVSVSDRGSSVAVVSGEARSNLDGFLGALNATDGRRFLFGGVNSSVRPMKVLEDGPEAALVAAFTARFGFPPGDPAAATITASDMGDFLETSFAAVVEQPAWSSAWSRASDDVIETRIAENETIATSVSANEPALRRLAGAYAMIGSLGMESLNAQARGAIIERARVEMGGAINDLVSLRATVGIAQSRTEAASERLTREREVIETRTSALESVDPYQAKVRFDQLSTQIEMSYGLTARLLRLSLINYT